MYFNSYFNLLSFHIFLKIVYSEQSGMLLFSVIKRKKSSLLEAGLTGDIFRQTGWHIGYMSVS